MGLYDCRDCRKEFGTPEALAEHVKQPHKLPCQQCAYKTTAERWLKQHERTHRSECLRCEKCAYKASTRNELRRHKLQKHGRGAPLRGKVAKKPRPAPPKTARAERAKNGAQTASAKPRTELLGYYALQTAQGSGLAALTNKSLVLN